MFYLLISPIFFISFLIFLHLSSFDMFFLLLLSTVPHFYHAFAFFNPSPSTITKVSGRICDTTDESKLFRDEKASSTFSLEKCTIAGFSIDSVKFGAICARV